MSRDYPPLDHLNSVDATIVLREDQANRNLSQSTPMLDLLVRRPELWGKPPTRRAQVCQILLAQSAQREADAAAGKFVAAMNGGRTTLCRVLVGLVVLLLCGAILFLGNDGRDWQELPTIGGAR